MIKVITPNVKKDKTVNVQNVNPNNPILCKKDGKIVGMIIHVGEGGAPRLYYHDYGMRISTNPSRSRATLIEQFTKLGYEFFIEDEV